MRGGARGDLRGFVAPDAADVMQCLHELRHLALEAALALREVGGELPEDFRWDLHAARVRLPWSALAALRLVHLQLLLVLFVQSQQRLLVDAVLS
jgi:hypothetical protein